MTGKSRPTAVSHLAKLIRQTQQLGVGQASYNPYPQDGADVTTLLRRTDPDWRDGRGAAQRRIRPLIPAQVELEGLEITESALLDEPDVALKHLNELSNFGLKLSIDDYGTGQSSLAYVKTLPVNELKIDRAFVIGVDATPKNAAIVRSTILLCQERGLSVVAEGAETAQELAWLEDNSCDLVQGYGIAKPMPLDEFLQWVHTFNQTRQQLET